MMRLAETLVDRVLPLDLLDPPARPSREDLGSEEMDELVASIRQLGLIEPLVVARAGARYEVVAGHRRFIACGRAGVVLVPCRVAPTKTAALEAITFAENRFRKDLSPAEEALWYCELLKAHGVVDTNWLADFLGESRMKVESRLLLLEGNARVFDAVRAGVIGVGVAEELNKVSDATHCHYLLYQAIEGGATRQIVAGWVALWKRDQMRAEGALAPVPAASSAHLDAQPSVYRCEVCGKSDRVHTITAVPVHDHCRLAILEPLLATYHGEDSVQ